MRVRALRRGLLSSREVIPGDFEIAPVLELIPSQTRPLDDEGTEALAFVQCAQSMRLDEEALAVSIDLDEPVQPDRVQEVKFHGVPIA